jgi:hypothetical protein
MIFHHIIPTNYLQRNRTRAGNLLLAHLVESDPVYVDFFSEEVKLQQNLWGEDYKYRHEGRILDNSAYELYRAGLPMFDGNKMIDLGKTVGAEYLVMPDYPAQHPVDTIEAALEFGPKFHEAGFKTFYVPQGRVGRVDDYCRSFAWAAQSDDVDYIGISIIAGPNAYGVDRPGSIQTYLARLTLCAELFRRGLIQLAQKNRKKIHFLGMTDGPNEIGEAMRFPSFIDSWDSSAATWAGIEGVRFDNSPTGLMNGKVKSHVDFSVDFDETRLSDIKFNIAFIDNRVRAYNENQVS